MEFITTIADVLVELFSHLGDFVGGIFTILEAGSSGSSAA